MREQKRTPPANANKQLSLLTAFFHDSHIAHAGISFAPSATRAPVPGCKLASCPRPRPCGIMGGMSMLNYGGINLEIEHVEEFSQLAVYTDDGSGDYLYTHVKISVRAVWNPKATAHRVNMPPAESMNYLRRHLLAPRKQLTFTVGGTAVIKSPLDRTPNAPYHADANNGPRPIACNIVEVHGSKTFIVLYSIETWINECPRAVTHARPVLSHRWEMSHDISSEFYTTRTITGEVIFRSDLMQRDWLPDDYRSTFFHPCPPGFRRSLVRVTAARDGISVNYTVVDEEECLSIRPGARHLGVVRIQGRFRGAVSQATLSYPTAFCGITVDVWGHKFSTRNNLVHACIRAIAAYNFSSLMLLRVLHSSSVEVDIVNKFVHAECSIKASGGGLLAPANAAEAGVALADNFPPMNLLMGPGNLGANGVFRLPEGLPYPDDPQLSLAGISSENAPIPGMVPPRDFGTRGNYIARVAASLLRGGGPVGQGVIDGRECLAPNRAYEIIDPPEVVLVSRNRTWNY